MQIQFLSYIDSLASFMDGALFCVLAILIILAYVKIATLRTRVTRVETILDTRAVDCGMQ